MGSRHGRNGEGGMNAPDAEQGPDRAPVPFTRLDFADPELLEELLAVVRGVAERGAFTLGEPVDGFEQEFAAYCETEFAVGVSSGTEALALALRALGDRPRRRGDRAVELLHRHRRGCQRRGRHAAAGGRRPRIPSAHGGDRRTQPRSECALRDSGAPVRCHRRHGPDRRARPRGREHTWSRTPVRPMEPSTAAGASEASA